MKKVIATVSLAVLMTFTPLSALAQSVVCPVQNCNRTTDHRHNGVSYSGHYAGDGHEHQVCNVSGCTRTGSHQHNGKTCLPHNNADGYKYHNGGNRSKSGHRGGRHH